jgi:L-amino acid N-acyltransferase YncA
MDSIMLRKKEAKMELRDAEAEDLGAILAIYNEVILTSTAVYAEEIVDLANRQAWFEARRRAGYPVLVAAAARCWASARSATGGPGPAMRRRSSIRSTSAPTGEGRGSAGRSSPSWPSGRGRPASM